MKSVLFSLALVGCLTACVVPHTHEHTVRPSYRVVYVTPYYYGDFAYRYVSYDNYYWVPNRPVLITKDRTQTRRTPVNADTRTRRTIPIKRSSPQTIRRQPTRKSSPATRNRTRVRRP
jgi:hypothetical protein